MTRLNPRSYLWLLVVLLAATPAIAPAAPPGHVAHDLALRLDPTRQRLVGRDRMELTHPPERLWFGLNRKAQIQAITIDEQPLQWARTGDGVEVQMPSLNNGRLAVEIQYRVVFDDEAPRRPVNTDNPGYGVRGTITSSGTVLLAGSGWYPQVMGMTRSINLTVTAPAGMLAVTSGRLEGHATSGDETISRWQIERPIGALSLCAGNYVFRQKRDGAHTVATYFSAQRQHLAEAYLRAGLRYLATYSELFGPYPFDHFAVVENFYPTGYGFPGFTLIGGRVLELPFIIPTSLRHEIAHCWWGNGVMVDTSQGNWCEGLATYVADYEYRAEQGEAEARSYRQQLLRNYTSLVKPEEAFPLKHFQGRRDRITKAVGYDKGALIFHMLHRRLGDGFWRALGDLFRERCFTAASWEDLQTYFERHTTTTSGRDLGPFFDQWLGRRDAPRLRLAKVAYNAAPGRLSGEVIQAEPPYELDMELMVTAAGSRQRVPIHLTAAVTPFQLPLATPPERVELDPDGHTMRRLWPAELPPTINRLKAAGEVVVRTPPGADEATLALAALLPRALGLRPLPADTPGAKATLWIGVADAVQLPPGARIAGDRLYIEGTEIPSQADTVFAVWDTDTAAEAAAEAGIAAIYWSPNLAAALAVARKIPHYGKYSYLGFEQATNVLKGTWPVTHSPMRVEGPVAQGEPP